jgi:hypothetical protein
MLARQAWRLIQIPKSLCAKLLKAKYYPRGCLVDTGFYSNASGTWQAVMHGLELLKQGIIWRVGNGSQIRFSATHGSRVSYVTTQNVKVQDKNLKHHHEHHPSIKEHHMHLITS